MATIGDNAADVTFEVEQGTDISIGFACQDATGTVPDFSGYTGALYVSQTYGGTVLLEASTTTRPDGTTGNGKLTTGLFGTAPNQWNVQVDIDHGTTDPLTDWGVGVWSLVLADSFGKRKRLMQGPAVLSRKVH